MKEEILTAKKWLRKGFAPVKNLISDEDDSIQQQWFEECLEKYSNYKTKILEDKIKEFREIYKKHPNISYYKIKEYDKHFNIQNNIKE